MDRQNTSRRLLLDATLAAGLFAVGCYEVLVDPLAEDVVGGPVWLDLLAVLATTAPLVWRRRAPFWVAVAVAAATAGRALAPEPLEIYPTSIALLVVTYTVASYAPLREALLALGFGAMAVSVAVVQGTGTDSAPDPLASAILYGAVWLVGRVVGVRHQRAEELHRERDVHAAEAVAAERARIAREMHDAVSHSLAAIVMQSGGAQNVLDSDPERARQSLAVIESTARRGLEEMRRMLGLLGETEAALAPQPGLDRLEELFEAVRAAGIEVRSSITGERRPLPAAVDVSAYRLVQEALTNVMKHAGASTVDVRVEQLPDGLDIEVVDDGAGQAEPSGDGRGLPGMRERVGVLRGAFEAGAGPSGRGFRVAARLPL
jgi:signal transduction histidine kinase